LASGPVPDLVRPPSIRDFLDKFAWHAHRIVVVRLASLKSWSIHFIHSTNRQELHTKGKSRECKKLVVGRL